MTFNTPPHATPDSPPAAELKRPRAGGGRKALLWWDGVGLAAVLSRRLARLGECLARAERAVTERFKVPPGGG